jgi:hypothetical protein
MIYIEKEAVPISHWDGFFFIYQLLMAAKNQNSGAEKMEPLNSHSKYNDPGRNLKIHITSPRLRHFLFYPSTRVPVSNFISKKAFFKLSKALR